MQESHLLSLRSRTLPPMWNFTNPQSCGPCPLPVAAVSFFRTLIYLARRRKHLYHFKMLFYGHYPLPVVTASFFCTHFYFVQRRKHNNIYHMQKGMPLGTPFDRIKIILNYSMISATTPEPTVLPPSRIAKRRPFSIAIGEMSSTVISTLSPGRHISTPSGRLITPVTSVVLK